MSENNVGAECSGGRRPSGVDEDQRLRALATLAASLKGIAIQAIPWLLCVMAIFLTVWWGLAPSVGLWLRYDHLAVPFTVGAIAWAIFRFCGSVRTPALIAFLLFIAFAVLFGTWQAGVTDGTTIAGLFPYSDAQGYFTDALRLLHGQKFSVFSSRRPLFPVFLTGILGITGLDLRLTLGVLTALAALAIGLAVREVQRSLGAAPGALLLISLFMFYRRYIGSTLTEQLGLAWGCVAFSLIWRAAAEARPRLAVCGLFFLSLALNTRAGAFFILPAIILWAGSVFRTPKGFSLRVATGCAAAVLLGFAVNGAQLSLVGTPTAAFSNFAYSLYGLVFSGSWVSALQQHPDLAVLSPVEQANRVYLLAWEQIRANPLVLLAGSLRAWTAFFVGHSGTWYSHLLYPSAELADAGVMLQAEGVVAMFRQQPLRVLLDVAGGKIWPLWLNVLLVTGLIVAWRNRRHPLALLTIFGWAGILVSVPFVPPWDADSMRAYAATLPFMIALPCLGVLYDAPDLVASHPERAPGSGPWMGGVLGLAALLLVLQIPVPLGLGVFGGWHWSSGGRETMCAETCDGATQTRALHIIPGAAVHVRESTPGRAVDRSGNYVSLEDIRARTHGHEFPDVLYMWRGLSRMEGGATLLSAYDLERGTTLYVQSSPAAFPPMSAQVSACGKTVLSGRIEWLRIHAFTACRPGGSREPTDPTGPKSEGTIR